MTPYKILVVDDEENLCEILRFNLKKEGYKVDTANSAEEVLAMNIAGYHLMLLDVMMGEISGFKLASILKEKQETARTPILFLTALDSESDIVKGFKSGADDYVTKPFSVKEVMLRVKAILKRAYESNDVKDRDKTIAFNGLTVDQLSKSVTVDGEGIELTRKEFDLLVLLLCNRGRLFSREDILRYVWTEEVVVLDRTVDVNMTRLRKKIGAYGKHISTRVGFGYIFEENI